MQREHILVNKPEYFFSIEEEHRVDPPIAYVHLHVRQWTPSVAKELKRMWPTFRQCVTCPLYAVTEDPDIAKWEAFVKAFGFKFVADVVCENGERRPLYVHCLEQKEKNNKNEFVVQPDTKLEPKL